MKGGFLMSEPIRWLALGYSVPIHPSKNRVYVWRKLKEYGAEYFKQGVALLPYNRNSFTKFKYLTGKIREMGGDASIVEMKFLDAKDEKEIVAKFRAQALEELTVLKKDCADILAELPKMGESKVSALQIEEIKKMIKRYSKARSRNHFCITLAQDVENGIYGIIGQIKLSTEDLSTQLAKAMDKVIADATK